MTVFIPTSRQSINGANQIKNALITSVVVGLLATQVGGCSRGIKPEVHEPVKLVKLAQPQTVLQPVFSANVGDNRGGQKDALDLQVGFGESRIIAASRRGELSGFDLAGKRLWRIDLGEPITGGVAYDDASQLAVVSTRSGKVIAVDGNSGERRWQQQLTGSVLTPALIKDNRVIVSANDGFLHGLSLQSGQSIWTFATQVPSISVRGAAKPTLLDSQTALIATADGRMHALKVATGIPVWSRRVGLGRGSSEIERMNDVDAMPVVDNGQLFAISYSGQMIGIDLMSGQVMFINDAASIRALALTPKLVIATTLEGKVIAYNRTSGELVWQSEALAYRQLTNPVMIGNMLAVGDLDGVVHLFDVSRGEIISRVRTKGALTSLHVVNQLLMTQSDKGQVAIWKLAR